MHAEVLNNKTYELTLINNNYLKLTNYMLVDKITKQTFSSRTDAIRQLGEKEFKRKSNNNELDYVQVR